MAHAGGARRKDRDVGAALALQFQLRAFEARANLIVGDAQSMDFGRSDLSFTRNLLVAEGCSCWGAVV